MTLFKNQRGFSPLIVVAVVVVLAALGGAGYYVWSKNQDDKDKKPTTSQNKDDDSKQDEKDKVEEPKIPQGFITYTNRELDFSFAYPEKIGQLTPTNGGADSLLYAVSADKANALAPHTQSSLYVSAKTKENFVTRAGKYGPVLEYKNGKWIVSAKEGGDVNNGGYAIGVEFKAPIARTIQGVPVYDLSYTDEGCHRSVWVFQNASAFVSIMLPAVCADEIDEIPQDRLATYKEVSDQILGTLAMD